MKEPAKTNIKGKHKAHNLNPEKNKIEPPKMNSIENAVEGQLKTIILNTEENFKDIKRYKWSIRPA